MPDNVDTFLAIIANAEDLTDVYKYIRRMNDSEIIAIYDKLLLQELLQIDLPHTYGQKTKKQQESLCVDSEPLCMSMYSYGPISYRKIKL